MTIGDFKLTDRDGSFHKLHLKSAFLILQYLHFSKELRIYVVNTVVFAHLVREKDRNLRDDVINYT